MLKKSETASKPSSLGSDIIRSSTVSIVFGANRSPAAGRSSISRMGRMCSSERNFQSGISRLNMTVAVSHLASAYAASRETVRGSGIDEHEVLFGEIFDRVVHDALAAHVERQAEHVIFVVMERRIGLLVGPVVGHE